jgi:hypothetical protein
MARVLRSLGLVGLVAPVGLAGCLLGWEPELGSETGGPTGLDTDTDDPITTPTCEVPAGGELCARYDDRVVTIGGTLTPEITSDQGFSDLYVYQGQDLQWHAWSDDLRNSLTSLVYGQRPYGVSEGGPAIPLVAGVVYEVQVDALCFDEACAEAVSSVYQEFTAEP